jgi:membrane-associated phospholipid phosphatase
MSQDLAFVLFAQAHRTPQLDLIFQSLSFLGEELFIVATLPIVFVLARTRNAASFAFAVLGTGWIVEILKIYFHLARPDFYAPGVAVEQSVDFGFPSGHAAFVVVYWGLLALWLNRSFGKILAVFLSIGVGISRVYRGMHFPTQVIAGWTLGAFILFLLIRFLPRPLTKVERLSPRTAVAISLCLPLALLLFGINPQIVSLLAAIQGTALGTTLFAYTRKYPNLLAIGTLKEKVLRVFVTLLFTSVIYISLKILGGHIPMADEVIRWMRYSLLGVCVTWLSPLVCERYLAGEKTAFLEATTSSA